MAYIGKANMKDCSFYVNLYHTIFAQSCPKGFFGEMLFIRLIKQYITGISAGGKRAEYGFLRAASPLAGKVPQPFLFSATGKEKTIKFIFTSLIDKKTAFPTGKKMAQIGMIFTQSIRGSSTKKKRGQALGAIFGPLDLSWYIEV